MIADFAGPGGVNWTTIARRRFGAAFSPPRGPAPTPPS